MKTKVISITIAVLMLLVMAAVSITVVNAVGNESAADTNTTQAAVQLF